MHTVLCKGHIEERVLTSFAPFPMSKIVSNTLTHTKKSTVVQQSGSNYFSRSAILMMMMMGPRGASKNSTEIFP